MSSAFNRSRSNPLIQRVRRHAAIATLFRAPLAPGDALTQPRPTAQAPLNSAGLPRTRAYALPAQPTLETPEFHAGTALPPADLALTQTSSAATSGPRNTNPPPAAIQRSAAHTATSPTTAPTAPGDERSAPASVTGLTSQSTAQPVQPAPVVQAAAPAAGLTSPSTAQPVQPTPVVQAAAPASPSPSTARPVQPTPVVRAGVPARASPSTVQPVQRTPVVRTAAPASPSPAAAPTTPGAPAYSGSVQPPPAAATHQPTSPQPSGIPDEEPKLSERDWNRLSTIMRRHQDAAAPQGQPSQPASSPTASQPAEPGTPAESAPQIIQRAPSSGSSPAVPNQPTAQSPAPASSANSSTAAPNADQPAPAQPAQASPDTLPAALPVGAHSQPPAGPLNQPTPTAETSPQTSPSANPPLIYGANYVPPESPYLAARPSAAAQEDTLPLGLEAAWPVQRRVADTPRPAQPAAPNLPPAPVPLDEQTRHVEHIQRALAGVSSGQPTGSKIEVIPPRQPRPAPASAARPGPDYTPEGQPPASFPALPIDPEAASPPTGSIQRADASQSPLTEAVPQARQLLIARPGASPMPAHLSEQMPLPGQPAEGDTTPPHLVDTDIGLLPADLWGLLGQSAPGSALSAQRRPLFDSAVQASQPNEAGQPSQRPAGTPDPPIQRTVIINDFETQASPSRPAVADGQAAADSPQASQSADGAEGEAFSSAQQPAADSSTPPEQQPAAPDLDDIARQVYSEVKNRLKVEWERLRRKM